MANKIDTTGMEIEMASLLKIKPYSNNPRFNAKSIRLLEEAITRYGFLVPITVDKDYVIVTGHSRYSAARNLDLKEIPVVVLDLPDLKIREYRIADNKVGEFSELDFNLKGAALVSYTEDDELMQLAFPSFAPIDPIKDMTKTNGDEEPVIIECICPDCLHEFDANSGIPFEIPNNTLPDGMDVDVDEEEINKVINVVIVNTAGLSYIDDIKPEARLEDDLGLGSLGRVEIIRGLESEFGIQLDDTKAEAVITIEDVYKIVNEALDTSNNTKKYTMADKQEKCEHRHIHSQDGLDECLDCGVRNY